MKTYEINGRTEVGLNEKEKELLTSLEELLNTMQYMITYPSQCFSEEELLSVKNFLIRLERVLRKE